jgi:adenosine deaminase
VSRMAGLACFGGGLPASSLPRPARAIWRSDAKPKSTNYGERRPRVPLGGAGSDASGPLCFNSGSGGSQVMRGQPPSPSIMGLPKLDLHVHQERSARLERVLARERGGCSTDWGEWAKRLMEDTRPGMPRLRKLWDLRPEPFNAECTPEHTVLRFQEIMDEGARDRAILCDIRVGHDSLLRPELIACFEEAERRTRSHFPNFHAEMTATIKLWHPRDEVEQALSTCIDSAAERIVGIDLINWPYDTDSDWRHAHEICQVAAAAGLGVTAHVGEFSPSSIREVLDLPGVTRLGHAVHVVYDERLLELVSRRGVAVECCLSSNVILGAVQSYDKHPILRFREHGIPVVLGTDDPLALSTSISREYSIAAAMGLSFQDLKEITRTAIAFAFTTAQRRQVLWQHVEAHDSATGS